MWHCERHNDQQINKNKTMKKCFLKLTLVLAMAAFGTSAFANQIDLNYDVYTFSEIKTVTFKVYGNCGMCEKTIEGSLADLEGVEKADWNKDSKMMEVTFDEEKISLDEIKKKIVAVGYDTEDLKADEKTYDALHGCCQYERSLED